MTSQTNHPEQDNHYADFTRIIFIFSFLLIAGLIFFIASPDTETETPNETTGVAVLIETPIASATQTPVAPTQTALPPTATRAPATELPVTATSAEETSTEADTSTNDNAAQIAAGAGLYVTCSACHGPDGQGIAGLGKPLVDNEFMAALSDEELVAFIKAGRDVFAPDNSTGIAMPPNGGNPALSDDDLFAIVAYIRSLQDD